MMNKTVTLLAAFLLAAIAGPAASSGGDIRLEPAPGNRLDLPSLQRGARTFVNYCLNCHSARFMRYNRLTDIGVDLSMIQDNLMFTTDRIGDTMTVAMTPQDGKAWFGVPPPDLSVIARVRGTDWLYNYFLGFYRDDAARSGWNNLVFPNVGMPHVLSRYSGTNRLVSTEYEDHEKAEAAAIAARSLVALAPARDHKYVVESLALETPGTLSQVEYKAMVADLVNYLDYMAEPVKNERISLGLVALLYFVLLFVFAYWLKREYWKDIH
jgi:ubiquinol-cytochrome c reductase cytochrome c1 subunit